MSLIWWSQRVLGLLGRSKHTENSSEANPPAHTRAEITLTVLPHLPNEIILAIVGRLEFGDLKSIRLLSKAWCICASPPLFAHLSVSPNKEDLDNFEAIAQHPQLRSHVHYLWYDGSEFLLQLSKTCYLKEWLLQLESHPWPLGPTHPRISDSNFNDFIQAVTDSRTSLKDFMTTSLDDFGFFHEGYRKYHEHAIYQQKCLQDGTFFDRLVQGLIQLDCLKVVTLECSWDFVDGELEPGKGSHLARNWDSLDCRPASWEWGPCTTKWRTPKNRGLPYKAGNGAEHYCILVSALAKAQRRIQAFQTGPDTRCLLPPYVFDPNLKTGKANLDSRLQLPSYVFDTKLRTRKTKALQFHDDNMIAFSGLEELKLGFATYGHLDTPKPGENIAGLPALLASMNHLKSLALRLPAFKDGFHNYYMYKQVFPYKMRWENLKTLALFQLRIDASDLILLFLDAMPGLKSLKMGELGLSQGCWEGVFEALKQMHRIEDLRLPNLTRFYHHGKRELVGVFESKYRIYRELTAYVENGKRHPFLRLGQPESAATEYTRDLEPVLRQRLLDLDSSYSHSEEDCDSMLAQGSDGGEVMDR